MAAASVFGVAQARGADAVQLSGVTLRGEAGAPRPNILFCIADDASFPHMGAYTVSAGSNFNGFDCGAVRKYYVASIVDGDPDEIRR